MDNGVSQGISDEVVGADVFDHLGGEAFFEVVEAIPVVFGIGVFAGCAPEVEDGAAVGLAELDGVPHHSVVGHDVAMFSGGGAVGVEEALFPFEENPCGDDLAFVGGGEEMGDAGFVHVLPHLAVVVGAMGVKALARGGFVHKFEVAFEGLV